MAPATLFLPRTPSRRIGGVNRLRSHLETIRDRRNIVVRQEGIEQQLSNGKVFIDASGGPSVSSVGYGVWEIPDFVRSQEINFVHDGAFRTQIGDQFEEALIRTTENLMMPIHICNSGSDAVEASMKVSIQFHVTKGDTKRHKFIGRKQAYHGGTFGPLSVGGHWSRRELYENALLKNTFHVSPCNEYRDRRKGESRDMYVARLAEELDQTFQREGPDEIAAFIMEPVVGAALGCVPALPGYMKAMKEVCHKYGALFIVDEVMCGMGRTGWWHAWQAQLDKGDCPDLQTIGKGLGSGYMPVAALLASEKITQVIAEQGLAHGLTYQGHPLACAAALKTMEIIERDGLLENVRKMGERLISQLRKKAGCHLNVGDIRGTGLFVGIEFVKNKTSKSPFRPDLSIARRFHDHAFNNFDIYIYYGTGSANTNGPEGDHILLSPPFNVTEEQIDEIVTRTVAAIESFFFSGL